jgi:hypothetical protein
MESEETQSWSEVGCDTRLCLASSQPGAALGHTGYFSIFGRLSEPSSEEPRNFSPNLSSCAMSPLLPLSLLLASFGPWEQLNSYSDTTVVVHCTMPTSVKQSTASPCPFTFKQPRLNTAGLMSKHSMAKMVKMA